MIARPRPNEETVDHLSNEESLRDNVDETVCAKLPAVADLLRQGELSTSMDMSGSISARVRRRQKVPVRPSPVIVTKQNC